MNTEKDKTKETSVATKSPDTAATKTNNGHAPDLDGDDDSEPIDYFSNLDTDDDDADALFEDDDKGFPLFDFAEPPVIKLKDGSEFEFKIPDLESERRADNLRKTLIITSPARVNGFNPTQETTDHATADVRYFIDNCLTIKGIKLDSDTDPTVPIDAKQVLRTEKTAGGKERRITPAHLVPVKHARAAAGRIYGGRIDVEKEKGAEKSVIVLSDSREIIVKQEFGVEQNDDGTFTRPTHIVRYFFREPTARELTAWQTKCFFSNKIPIKGGGSREERFFNTEKTVDLFDALISRVTGACYKAADLNVRDTEHLKGIPVGIKRNAITFCMGEVSGDVGN